MLFIEHFVPIGVVFDVDLIGIVIETTLCLYNLLNHGDVPMVDLSGLSVRLETDGQLLIWFCQMIGAVMHVVVLVGRQFDDKHVRIIRAAMVA